MKVATAILAAILSLAIATFAVAEPGGWNVRTRKDPMTNRMETSAVLMPRDGGTALLYVACLNGKVTPRLVYARSIGYVQVGGTWRLDDAPVRSPMTERKPGWKSRRRKLQRQSACARRSDRSRCLIMT